MRIIKSLNENWELTFPYGERNPDTVNLPHTWNAIDGMGDSAEYLRTSAVYRTACKVPKQPVGESITYIEVLAASLKASIKINGKPACSHAGGYSLFRSNISEYISEEINIIEIEVNNEDSPDIYPGAADFTFYGGLYRGVNLISVPPTHFDLDYYGGQGIVVSSTPVDGGAVFNLRASVTNPDDSYTVQYIILNAAGEEKALVSRPSTSPEVPVFVPDITLWSMDNPYLYTVKALLLKRNEAVDEIEIRTGVREYCVYPDKGFFINGISTPLRGVSRHQDMLYKGCALSKDDHYNDARLIKELGANTIRLGHYQHSQDFLDACDELGFAVWAEIPFISVYKESSAARENCMQQMRELVVQNINHPSIMFWGLSNEILIGGISQQMIDDHYDLEKLVKELDPTRLTAIAHLTTTPDTSPMHGITDLESFNHYYGWYGGKLSDNGPWLDKFHVSYPNICLGISEYGAEGIICWHSNNPECKDYTEEYQAFYHETMARVFEERPWVWATHVWNMFDFGSIGRDEGGVKGRNNKGLVTIDRKTKKDSFYVYQAFWSKVPMVHIAGKRYSQRSGDTVSIKVYSNQPSVDLYVNGEKTDSQNGDRVFSFSFALKKGFNSVVAVAGSVKDCSVFEKVDSEPSAYTLPEVSVHKEGIANWFKQVGPLHLDNPMEFPEGRYNINIPLNEIVNNGTAFELVVKAVRVASNITISTDAEKWPVMSVCTPKEIFDICAPGELGEQILYGLNSQLIRIKK